MSADRLSLLIDHAINSMTAHPLWRETDRAILTIEAGDGEAETKDNYMDEEAAIRILIKAANARLAGTGKQIRVRHGKSIIVHNPMEN
jgi:hypothetical protein